MTSEAKSVSGARGGSVALVLSLTLVRIPLAAAFAVLLLAAPQAPWRLWACVAIVVAIELSDLADGMLARRQRVASELGAALDPYADSVSRLTVYWSLAAAGLALWPVPLVMAVRDVTVAYSRILLARRGRTVAAAASGKIKAICQGAAALGLLLVPLLKSATDWAAILSWLVICVTAASAVEYVWKGCLVLGKEADE
jgi:CDP-diacylglycerol--glycerol-3-phosphate 3-phosphatidyltransferase